MKRSSKGAAALALGVSLAMSVAACSSGGGDTSTAGGSSSAAAGTKGGTINVLDQGPIDHLDPQRMYTGWGIEWGNRLFTRTLTTFSPDSGNKLIGDLATDTGTQTDGGKTWSFTLRSDAKWQDGKPVTCADVAYGSSRTFAADVITGGPNYGISYFDIPKNPDGSSTYAGPYKGTNQAAYDKAVTCNGQTVTFHLNTAVPDFNQTVTMPEFAAFRKDQDKGAGSDFLVFSDGPYQLDGTFDPNKGGTFVRNPNYDVSTDPFRKALPDKFVFTEGLDPDVIYQRLIANGSADQTAVSPVTAPPAELPQLATVSDRADNVDAPYVNYLALNFKTPAMSQAAVRQAFAMATNKDAYVTANGGTQVMKPTNAIINPTLQAYKQFDPFGVPSAGDATKAKAVLTQAGITTPVNITVAYRKTPTADKAFAAMQQTWQQAGFNVTLNGIAAKYYPTIQDPKSAGIDVFWAGWGADWPSGSAVIPPLFDGRINISSGGSGQDYGYFNDDAVNKAMDQAMTITDPTAFQKAWGDIDETIVKQGGAVPLVSQKFNFAWGSNVKGFTVNSQLGGYVDFATIAAQ